MSHRPGKNQRAILEALAKGARLYQESGIWHHDDDGYDRVHVSGTSCRGLLEHGYIYNDHTEEHPFWRGGVRWRYAATELGKAAVAPQEAR